jgi:hypothetical protein
MNYVDRIDWNNHDGVNLSMINDFVRNQFYNDIVMSNVQNHSVLDIGFGTGLLSLLCLKHGATQIVAYESDRDRFLLGQEIIQKLELANKIRLINQRFCHSDFQEYANFIAVSETVNGNLWQEGLYNTLPRQPGTKLLPDTYFLELYCATVPARFASGLGCKKSDNQPFDPGVDIDVKFVDLINQYIEKNYVYSQYNELTSGINQFEVHIDTAWRWIPHMRTIDNQNLIAGYYLNSHDCTITFTKIGESDIIERIDFDRSFIDLTVENYNTGNSTVLIVPRVGMLHGTRRIYLDRGHWGPTLSPVIVHESNQPLLITHNLLNGDIGFEFK